MKQVVIRNLDDSILLGLKKIAWRNGETPEQCARRLLIEAVRFRDLQQPIRVTAPAA